MAGLPLTLIVGLGNPGPTYARTRHNAGFELVDELARRSGASLRHEGRHQGDLGRANIAGTEVWLLKPMTYMNLSGQSVRSVAGFYRIAPQSILVAHDELDFAPGVVRLKEGGGAGGHNGLRDLIEQLGDEFWRLRIGIGRPEDRDAVLNYVLGRPPAAEADLIHEAVLAAADAVLVMLTEGAQKAMNRLHVRSAALPASRPPA
ncbi:MAG TPA: aminoacyl-tRNA hydrolase [Steroidobacteraceae bacterium]|nr:aminoacyl-tRNA hydrolase [Steroidobacteraceae bacterium]